ncbi:hypothetical protein CAPTEDRAFT_215878, partial [Capitella teleta]
NEVYAWGNNAMGQCGQGHSQSPVTRPKKVMGLDGVLVHQISAGTSHSLAWTAVPRDRQVVSWHRPFCVDLQESTFSLLRSFLERYCDGFDSDQPVSPFPSKEEQEHFVLLCLRLLITHLLLALAGDVSTSLLGSQAKLLRNLLFRMMDMETPLSVQEAVNESLSIGAPLLLPPLAERMELLHTLLPQGPTCWGSLSRGQRQQVTIILNSLRDNSHVASVLGFTSGGGESVAPDNQLAGILMKTLLKNLGFHVEQCFNALSRNAEKSAEDCFGEFEGSVSPPGHLRELLASLHKHLLAHCLAHSADVSQELQGAICLLHQHLSLMFPLCGDIIERTIQLLQGQKSDNMLKIMNDILLPCPAGCMLSSLLTALLLLPVHCIRPLLHELLSLLTKLDVLNRLLPAADVLEKQEMEWPLHATPSSLDVGKIPLPEKVTRWVWLVDMERTCSLLIGRCLGGMVYGPAPSPSEKITEVTLTGPVFGNGLLASIADIERVLAAVDVWSTQQMQSPLPLPTFVQGLNDSAERHDLTLLWQLALGSAQGRSLFVFMEQWAKGKDLDTSEIDGDFFLDAVSRFLLATLLRHCGSATAQPLPGSEPSFELAEIFLYVYKMRRKLWAFHATEEIREGGSEDGDMHDDEIMHPDSTLYDQICRQIIQKCSFLLIGVQPVLKGGATKSSLSSDFALVSNLENAHGHVDSLMLAKERLRKMRWWHERLRRLNQASPSSSEQHNSALHKIASNILSILSTGMKEVDFCKLMSGDDADDPLKLAIAMACQQERAECRLEAQNQILEMLLSKSEGASLLLSVQFLFFSACFGLSSALFSESTNLYSGFHYQDGIKTARCSTQAAIQITGHRVYEQVVALQSRTADTAPLNDAAKKFLLLTIFATSVKFDVVDVSLAVSCGLLPVLSHLCASPLALCQSSCSVIFNNGTSHLDTLLTVASARALHILAVSVGWLADDLSPSVLQSVLDVLWGQADVLMESLGAGVESGRDTIENYLGDLLSLIRRIAGTLPMKRMMASSPKWTTLLLKVIGYHRSGAPIVGDTRTRLLGIHFMESVLPFCSEANPLHLKEVVGTLLDSLSAAMWSAPIAMATSNAHSEIKNLQTRIEELSSTAEETADAAETPENLVMSDMNFDPGRMFCCSIEQGHTLAHGAGGRGYGLCAMAVSSGCYQWKFLIVKENKGNEGTCVGVSKWPLKDFSHRTTSDMWLYRAYSGNLYHNGEQSLTLPGFTQGDYITCILDMHAKTISFGKNGEEPKVAFEDVDGPELFPCVMFYSSNPGEKVKITDMMVKGGPPPLLPGDPHCAPFHAVKSEALCNLLRLLHSQKAWNSVVNEALLSRLQPAGRLADRLSVSPDRSPEEPKDPDAEMSIDAQMEQEENLQKQIKKDVGSDFSALSTQIICKEIWPALVVMGGVDRGLRMGGRCVKKQSTLTGTLLGLLKKDAPCAKVLWDDTEASVRRASSSDVALSNLEPIEAPAFKPEMMTGLTTGLLDGLTKLTFISDEKILSNPLFPRPKKPMADAFKERCKTEAQQLEEKLDADIARALGEGEDHNADKKHPVVSRACESSDDDEEEGLSDFNEGMSTSLISAVREDDTPSPKEDPTPPERDPEVPVRPKEPVLNLKSSEKEFEMHLVASVQLGALKALHVLLGSSCLLDPLIIHSDMTKNDDLKDMVRNIIRQMVKRAVLPSPIKRTLSVAELERAHSVLYQASVQHQAQQSIGLKAKMEELQALTGSDPNEGQVKSSRPEPPQTSLPDLQLPNVSSLCDLPPPPSPPPVLPISREVSRSRALRSMELPSLSSRRTSPINPLLRALTSDLREPSPPWPLPRTTGEPTTTLTPSMITDPNRSASSTSPPPPPVAAPLLDMGFSLPHIMTALDSTGTSRELRASSVNALATWMIDHPFEPPASSVPSEQAASAPSNGSFPAGTVSEPPTPQQEASQNAPLQIQQRERSSCGNLRSHSLTGESPPFHVEPPEFFGDSERRHVATPEGPNSNELLSLFRRYRPRRNPQTDIRRFFHILNRSGNRDAEHLYLDSEGSIASTRGTLMADPRDAERQPYGALPLEMDEDFLDDDTMDDMLSADFHIEDLEIVSA